MQSRARATRFGTLLLALSALLPGASALLGNHWKIPVSAAVTHGLVPWMAPAVFEDTGHGCDTPRHQPREPYETRLQTIVNRLLSVSITALCSLEDTLADIAHILSLEQQLTSACDRHAHAPARGRGLSDHWDLSVGSRLLASAPRSRPVSSSPVTKLRPHQHHMHTTPRMPVPLRGCQARQPYEPSKMWLHAPREPAQERQDRHSRSTQPPQRQAWPHRSHPRRETARPGQHRQLYKPTRRPRAQPRAQEESRERHLHVPAGHRRDSDSKPRTGTTSPTPAPARRQAAPRQATAAESPAFSARPQAEPSPRPQGLTAAVRGAPVESGRFKMKAARRMAPAAWKPAPDSRREAEVHSYLEQHPEQYAHGDDDEDDMHVAGDMLEATATATIGEAGLSWEESDVW